jgi:heme a synthase
LKADAVSKYHLSLHFMLDPDFSSFSNTATPAATPGKSIDFIRRLVWKIAIATWLLMAVGSATRVMNAGLACPDWPLCYGQLIPSQQMNLQVFLEWFHRADAGAIGLSTLGLLILSIYHRDRLPKWLPSASLLALVLIFIQAGLGALTVTELLRFDLVSSHLGVALLFFTTLLAIATSLAEPQVIDTPHHDRLLRLSIAAGVIIYLQSILGALVGSQWAAHQCLTTGDRCGVMNAHLLGIIPAIIFPAILVFHLWRASAAATFYRQIAIAIGCLLCLQLALGFATFKLHLQIEPLTVSHQAIGAALLGTIAILTVNLIRTRDRSNLPNF